MRHFIFVLLLFFAMPVTHAEMQRPHNSIEAIQQQYAMEQEANKLEVSGKIDDAIELYAKADEYNRAIVGFYNGVPFIGVVRCLQKQGKYREALDKISSIHSDASYGAFNDRKKELEALIQGLQTGSRDPIYVYINYLRGHYKEMIPPIAYDSVFGKAAIDAIIRMYDFAGDQDAGIRYIDEMLAYFKQTDIKKYGEYKPGKVDAEYMKVREAFEKDKAEGFKGCLNAKEGEVCMGRATKALIDSDYFPW